MTSDGRHLVINPHGIAMPKGIYFTAVVLTFFFLLFSTPNLWGHWTDLSQALTQYSLIAAIWKIWSEFPRAWGKKPFWDRLGKLTEHISATEHDINNRKKNLSIYRALYMSPNLVNFGPETAENSWRVFVHPLYFRIGRHCQPYRMDIM